MATKISVHPTQVTTKKNLLLARRSVILPQKMDEGMSTKL